MPPDVEKGDIAETSFRLGDWLVEPRLNRLTRGGDSIQIEHKMMDVLVCLAESPGDLVSRQHIIDTVWAIEFISEGTLTRIVAELRRVLGDDAREPRFIETIRGRGYRLLVPVEVESQPSGTIAQFPVRAQEDDRSPYPGLAAFTEADAEFFFGREGEVNNLWRTITSRRLLAVIGPSGVGKTSFLRAGLLPATPEGWGTLICQPGEAPFAALARALAPEFEGDVEGISKLVDISDPARAVAVISRWRDRHEQALLIVDQFEELFTLNPSETQARFAALLGRLARDVDVHVVLSMRDDFLYRCHEQEPLTPIFSGLVPVKVPAHDDLRRALVEPAARFGYAFEDESLVGEMLDAVAGERGALPLLAFAVERLWVHRDREKKLLTRRAYTDIGGVAGALAHHAETTLERIGAARLPVVRELFRNLVTAEGTRAVHKWDELLSVFEQPQRPMAEAVLRALIDARLLTSYEIREEGEEPTRKVEIIHESLLVNWPRLVGWQTQDADAARVRDQLRQAARTWDEHGRTDDMLWTGSAYREFSAWLVHYPGGLTETEAAFAEAMTRHAERRSRRRRIAAAAALTVAVVVAAVFAALWQRSVLETRRAEAQKLLALAQVQLDTDPTEALAYVTSSLELADTHEARALAVRALWAGPPVRAIDLPRYSGAYFQRNVFSRDGRWLAVSPIISENVLVFNERGGEPIVLGAHTVSARGAIRCGWTRDGLLVTGHWSDHRARVWSMPGGDLVRTIDFGESEVFWKVGDEHLLAEIGQMTEPGEPWPLKVVRWQLPDGRAEALGTVDFRAVGATSSLFDPRGDAWIYSKGDGVYSRPLPVKDGVPDALLGRHSSDGVSLLDWDRGGAFFSVDSHKEIILWALAEGEWSPSRRIPEPETATADFFADASGRWVSSRQRDAAPELWDRTGMEGAGPWILRRRGDWILSDVDFHPHGDWVIATTNNRREVSFWPLSTPRVFETTGWAVLEFTPDGRYLLSQDLPEDPAEGMATRLRLWPMPGSGSPEVVDVALPADAQELFRREKLDAAGERMLSSGWGTGLFVIPLNGADPYPLEGFPESDVVDAVGFSPSGRLAAAANMITEGRAELRVWDLHTSQVRVFEQPQDPEAYEGLFATTLAFADEMTLYTAGANGLLRWDLQTGASELLMRAPKAGTLVVYLTSDRHTLFVVKYGGALEERLQPVTLRDLRTGNDWELGIPGVGWLGFSPDGTIWVTGEPDSSILVGRVDGGEPHLLLGHEGSVGWFLAVSPDNRWVASCGGPDKTLHLWPMPDLSKPPLHTMPRDELIAKLKTLTNLRAVRDKESSSGWTIEVGPFPGWETVPSW